MSLRRKLIVKELLLVGGLAAMIAACLLGLRRQQQHVQAALLEYANLRYVQDAELQLVNIKSDLPAQSSRAALSQSLRGVQQSLRKYRNELMRYDSVLPPEIDANQRHLATAGTDSASADVAAILASLDTAPAQPIDAATRADVASRLDRADRTLATLLQTCALMLNTTTLASAHELRIALLLVAILALVTLCGACFASVWHYRRIMIPLRRLRAWCGRTAAGDFSETYAPGPEREFQEVALDVNRMAAELHGFYRQLEEMVVAKSKDLARAERLASVGFLAAGVAHEINNPLNIISGYAELSTRRLNRCADIGSKIPAVEEVLQSLNIVREEAFRCKEITSKLLSLARGGSQTRQRLSLLAVAGDVISMVRGVRSFQGRSIRIAHDSADPLDVLANMTEMKQVLLNLFVNALEAVPAGGEVVVEGWQEGEQIGLTVTDNGRGMTASALQRVFEPFYTDKRGSGEPGTGLGLSITQAIITDHGGDIRAESDGLGHGSRFIIHLPAARRRGEEALQEQEAAVATMEKHDVPLVLG